jgi:hypothetical protein
MSKYPYEVIAGSESLVENPPSFNWAGAQMVRRILAFLVAIGTLIVLGSVGHSLFVQHAWLDAAANSGLVTDAIPVGDRVRWMGHDLIGLLPSYGGLAAVALLLGLLVAGAVTRYTGYRPVVFAVAGAACMFTMFTILKMVLGTVGVFGARGAGLLAQVLAGLVAAMLFAKLTEAPAKRRAPPPATT